MSKIVSNKSGKSSSIQTGVGIGVSLLFALTAVPLTGASAIQVNQTTIPSHFQYYSSSPMLSSNTNVSHKSDEDDNINLVVLQNEDGISRSVTEMASSSIVTIEKMALEADRSITLPSVKTFEVDLLIDFDDPFSNSYAPEQVV